MSSRLFDRREPLRRVRRCRRAKGCRSASGGRFDRRDLPRGRGLSVVVPARTRGIPVAWLVGVARHVVAAELRRQSRDRAVVSRISGRRLLDAGDSLGRIEERIDAEREARRLYDALAALPRRDRALMELVRHRRVLDHRSRSCVGAEARHRAGPAAPQPRPDSGTTATVGPGGHLMSLDTFEESLTR